MADADKVNDSHAMASMRIKEEFSDGTYEDLEQILKITFKMYEDFKNVLSGYLNQ